MPVTIVKDSVLNLKKKDKLFGCRLKTATGQFSCGEKKSRSITHFCDVIDFSSPFVGVSNIWAHSRDLSAATGQSFPAHVIDRLQVSETCRAVLPSGRWYLSNARGSDRWLFLGTIHQISPISLCFNWP